MRSLTATERHHNRHTASVHSVVCEAGRGYRRKGFNDAQVEPAIVQEDKHPASGLALHNGQRDVKQHLIERLAGGVDAARCAAHYPDYEATGRSEVEHSREGDTEADGEGDDLFRLLVAHESELLTPGERGEHEEETELPPRHPGP